MIKLDRMIENILFSILILFFVSHIALADDPTISEDTELCLECHATINPGIVSDWKKSRHALITPAQALKKSGIDSILSGKKIPEALMENVVGCAECHTMNPEKHADNVEHSGYEIHPIVTPDDCALCHQSEVNQFQNNLMSHAYGNLQNNHLYRSLVNAVNGVQSYKDNQIHQKASDPETDADSCLYCHGTMIQVTSMQSRETDHGDMTFPILSGWPNQGVGRINPDGTKGSCSVCHTRHQFSIAMARDPYTCAECHNGPDVPAYNVYKVSKHGNIHQSLGKDWDLKAVPWTLGRDFTAPTCAACHISLIVSTEGDVITQRTHQMNDRLPWRIFGLIYAHAHPKSPDTASIKNREGLPLPTELTGEPVNDFLIDQKEQEKRQSKLEKICLSCHSLGWVKGHFTRFKKGIETTNVMTRTATDILVRAWGLGAAKGPAQKDDIFNEFIEKKWVEQWLFYANSTRFASAMAGADYGVFANGRWYMSKNIREMLDWLEFKSNGVLPITDQ
ncbi:MAG: hydroxylamine oxidase [Deltaproteobacteria bacterium]|nr:hydroxylamine oxidase [Deltaproteobacteria bacterium]